MNYQRIFDDIIKKIPREEIKKEYVIIKEELYKKLL